MSVDLSSHSTRALETTLARLRRGELVTLEGLSGEVLEVVLAAVLAERAARPPAPELVWSGPSVGPTRDTEVTLKGLFEEAQEHVFVAGFAFDHSARIFAPLARRVQAREIKATMLIDLRERAPKEARDRSWPFPRPWPRFYYDARHDYASQHAKCVLVDERVALVGSANFTDRGQRRNIEAGVLVRDPIFVEQLAAQLNGLLLVKGIKRLEDHHAAP
ncbi:DISARM system phospholipase D-like protein DrmC [Myxococcota bacterium]|nr:DISARM system phospholipase D-like protein DrmC [Myxococcota bacterium]